MIIWSNLAQCYIYATCEGRLPQPRKINDLPCDLRKLSYCTRPGEAYPRNAVRKFVDDNQGLMRRMYGDLRHLSVLRSEMEEPSGAFMAREAYTVNVEDEGFAEDSEDVQNTTSTTQSTNTTSSTAQSASATTTPTVVPQQDKGVNACPTKPEVVAPYWAVNTRGRTLAIVNDPPYEQHVHWEKCVNEGLQMLCRIGCKCEQQYRLQRLLAFDPTCDCKGIFMDWFLLPSCCVCKCYGLNFDLLNATSNATTGSRQGRDHPPLSAMLP